jgi:hypothetical protein
MMNPGRTEGSSSICQSFGHIRRQTVSIRARMGGWWWLDNDYDGAVWFVGNPNPEPSLHDRSSLSAAWQDARIKSMIAIGRETE